MDMVLLWIAWSNASDISHVDNGPLTQYNFVKQDNPRQGAKRKEH